MTPPLATTRPDGPIYRVSRQWDALAWPDWSYAHEDGTFGNRCDYQRGEYRVLYASGRRVGAFAETLARFRADIDIAAEYRSIEGDPEDEGYPDPLPAGVVPSEWPSSRGRSRDARGGVRRSRSLGLACASPRGARRSRAALRLR
jgi:RES domain